MAMLRTRRLTYGHLVTKELDLDIPNLRVAGIVYTVPAGNRAIIRDIRCGVDPAVSPDAAVWLNAQSGSLECLVWGANVPAGARGAVWHQGDIVLEAGDLVKLYSTALSLWYWISGGLLPIPAVVQGFRVAR